MRVKIGEDKMTKLASDPASLRSSGFAPGPLAGLAIKRGRVENGL
jgi:hypothetical protein